MTGASGNKPALILDRDGVINEDVGFLWQIERCRFVEGIFDLAKAFAARGFLIVVASNQSGIGRGLFGEAEYQTLMDYIRGEFSKRGVHISAAYHCPDHPTEGIGRFRRDSPWRKPKPGMILAAQKALGFDIAHSWGVGNEMRDIIACRDAGVGTLVMSDPQAKAPARKGDFWIVPRLADVIALLAEKEKT
jgi:D-glycero-D-manno-heptose 1,7-bisphosphate phosphatase